VPRISPRTVLVTTAALVAVLATAGSVLAAREARPAHRPAAPPVPAEVLPPAAAFRPGTCRTIAEPVLAIARLHPTLATATTVSPTDRTRLAGEQRKLIAARAAAEPDLGTPLDGLVTSIGFVRLRADTHSYDPALWHEADARRRAVQQLCAGRR
jgi:hypothetical protein